MPYYNEATHGQSDKVWSNFHNAENSYQTGKTYNDEVDSKYTGIGTLQNKTENIEDKYYGENKNTYSNDSKYYHGTNFGPSGPSGKTDNSWLLWVIGGIIAITFYTQK